MCQRRCCGNVEAEPRAGKGTTRRGAACASTRATHRTPRRRRHRAAPGACAPRGCSPTRTLRPRGRTGGATRREAPQTPPPRSGRGHPRVRSMKPPTATPPRNPRRHHPPRRWARARGSARAPGDRRRPRRRPGEAAPSTGTTRPSPRNPHPSHATARARPGHPPPSRRRRPHPSERGRACAPRRVPRIHPPAYSTRRASPRRRARPASLASPAPRRRTPPSAATTPPSWSAWAPCLPGAGPAAPV